MNYRYVYEKMGAQAPEYLLENELWIDVGNAVRDGVLDHHQEGGLASSFAAVMTREDCYKSVRSYLAEVKSGAELIFHVHEYPDLDCIAGVYAVQRMISGKKNVPAAAFSERVREQLMDYVNTSDAGRKKYLSDMTLYAYVCQIGKGMEDPQERSRKLMEEGLALFDRVVSALENTDTPIDLFTAPLDQYIDTGSLEAFDQRKEKLEEARKNYQKDKAENRVILEEVSLWNSREKKMQPVRAAVWRSLPSDEDGYLFARDIDQCLLTIYPYEIKEKSEKGVTRALISLNPNLPEAGCFSLLPMAEVLEQWEQLEEEALYQRDGSYRRDHSCPRERKGDGGRFLKKPFIETNDPWYISERGDMIDAPGSYSILSYKKILSVVESASYLVKSCKILHFKIVEKESRSGEVEEQTMRQNSEVSLHRIRIEEAAAHENISFGRLYALAENELRALQGREIGHLFIFVKIHPSMLKYSNAYMKACCLNMVGKGNSNISEKNIFYTDYRTCLYTDQSITIFVAADWNNPSLAHLIDKDDLKSSIICTDLRNLQEHQLELRDIGVNLSEMISGLRQEAAAAEQWESTEIDRFNERLVRLNAIMEKDNLISNPLEQEVFAFIKNILEIEALKRSVTTSAQLLIKNAEQQREREIKKARLAREEREKQEEQAEKQRDAEIQAGISLLSILAVFSAWVDAFDFIARLDPDVEDNWWELRRCPPLFAVGAFAFALILIFGIIACKNAIKAFHIARKAKNK